MAKANDLHSSTVLKRIARDTGVSFHMSWLVQIIATFPSLAPQFTSDREFTARWMSTLCNGSVGWIDLSLIGVFIRLSYRIRENEGDAELQKRWLDHLVELNVPHTMADLMLTLKPSHPSDPPTLLWNSRCFLPILQDFLQHHQSVVLESKLIKGLAIVLGRLAEKDEALHSRIGLAVRASDVLDELRQIIKKYGPDKEPGTSPSPEIRNL